MNKIWMRGKGRGLRAAALFGPRFQQATKRKLTALESMQPLMMAGQSPLSKEDDGLNASKRLSVQPPILQEPSSSTAKCQKFDAKLAVQPKGGGNGDGGMGGDGGTLGVTHGGLGKGGNWFDGREGNGGEGCRHPAPCWLSQYRSASLAHS